MLDQNSKRDLEAAAAAESAARAEPASSNEPAEPAEPAGSAGSGASDQPAARISRAALGGGVDSGEAGEAGDLGGQAGGTGGGEDGEEHGRTGGEEGGRGGQPQREDAELVAAFQAGDRTALEQLYFRHAERVWRYARYFSGRDDVAAEIVQETFLRVIKHLAKFEGRAKFTTWLYTLARSAAVTEMTRKRDRGMKSLSSDAGVVSAANAAAPVGSDPLEAAERGETRRAVRDAVARLPEAEREALVLFEMEGLSMQEAGEVLGWSTAKMKVTVFRARRRLRDVLLKKV